jgi:adenylate cyclase
MILVCVPVALVYDLLDSALRADDDGLQPVVAIIVGIAIAMPLALLEESQFDEWTRRLPFSAAIAVKSLTYVGSLLAVFMSMGLAFGLAEGLQWEDFFVSLTQPDYYVQAAVGWAVYVTVVFARKVNRLLGPGQLRRYVMGRYHHPRREGRIFMFLDLKSSTALAEQLGPEKYYQLVNDFFRDISGPVLDRSGEIYEYVGDEAVLTWKEENGIRDANCIRVFFDIDATIAKRRQRYLDRFGVVPEFKAGVHVGEVMTAEIGDLKRGLVFNGDVLNTGSRIEGECGRLGKRLLSSAELVDRLTLPDEWQTEHVGPVTLRGKAEPLELVALA